MSDSEAKGERAAYWERQREEAKERLKGYWGHRLDDYATQYYVFDDDNEAELARQDTNYTSRQLRGQLRRAWRNQLHDLETLEDWQLLAEVSWLRAELEELRAHARAFQYHEVTDAYRELFDDNYDLEKKHAGTLMEIQTTILVVMRSRELTGLLFNDISDTLRAMIEAEIERRRQEDRG